MRSALNPTTSTPQIPHELVREILEHLEDDKSSLCAISLSSTVLRHNAQMILFRTADDPPTESAHIKFLRTVAASPGRLALLVRTYSISRTNISWDLSERIHDGLLVMRNLKRLSVCYMGDTEMKSPEGPASVLLGCPFKLQNFQWISHPSESVPIDTFLRSQNLLKCIFVKYTCLDRITSLKHILPFPSTSPSPICPQLVTLAGDWNTIKTLLPGTKVTLLMVFEGYNRPTSNKDVIIVAPELKHIKGLVYSFERDREHILRHCVSLKILDIWIFDEGKILFILPKLPALHRLIISNDSRVTEALKVNQAVVQRIFDSSTLTLTQIDVREERETFVRYTRSPGTASIVGRVSQSEVHKWATELEP